MDKGYERSEPRVLYRAACWLRSAEGDSAFIGETRNLSRRGMFVSVAPAPSLGDEVLCELPGQRAMRGRVAWVFTGGEDRTGVGIEFVDLSEPESSLLERLVGVRLDDTQPLQVHFDGLPSPIRATGRVTHEGIDLSTTLGFLRLGGAVSVSAAGTTDARLHGRIARVALRTDDGAPRLQISLALLPDPQPIPEAADDERWFPEIVVTTAASELAFEATPFVVGEPEPTERTDMAPVVASALVFERPPRARPGVRGPFWALIAGGLVATGIAAVWLATPARAPREDARVEVTTVETPVDPVGPIPAAADKARAAEPAAVDEPAEPAAAEPIRLAPIQIEATRGEPASADEPPLNPHANPVASGEHPAEAAEPAHVVEPIHVAAAAVARAPEPRAASLAAWRPEVKPLGGAATVFVPVSGTRGMTTFQMSDPPGIAIDLPHGRAEIPLRSQLLHDDALRSLWVRARPTGGIQIRLHVAPGVHVGVDAVDGGVRFRKKG